MPKKPKKKTESDDLLGERAAPPTQTGPVKQQPTASKKTRLKSDDRHFDAKKQDRPVREGTIRHQMLQALLAGETSIPKLMKKFGQPRPLTVAHIHEMHKCHGYGYTVKGDEIKIVKPVGGELKGKTPAAKPKGRKEDANDDLM